jgi:hypothetical protein
MVAYCEYSHKESYDLLTLMTGKSGADEIIMQTVLTLSRNLDIKQSMMHNSFTNFFRFQMKPLKRKNGINI